MINVNTDETRTDISSETDVRLLVHKFYDKVRQDELLAGIFEDVIRDRWPIHLETMTKFWHAVLLGGDEYSGRPFLPHASLPIGTKHFNRWLLLFSSTIDAFFCGEKADEAKWRAEKMATMFISKIEYIRANPEKRML